MINARNELPVYAGVRYIPQLDYSIPLKNNKKFDFEASANIYGNAGFHPFDSLNSDGKIKPYRLWARYSSQQLEIRAGLQKINFGSASLLRPLMWFDQVDPRDPLKLTDGVWGILGRYYFLNNINVWMWGLYGNNDPRGWEIMGNNKNFPEAGGRIQLPLGKGDAALSFNHRMADSRNLAGLIPEFSEIPENKLGFDMKLDLAIGCWLEGSWVNRQKNLGVFTNQEILNAGLDYTVGVGNGLYLIFEQLLASNDQKAFSFQNTVSFSLLSASYPVGIFDNLSGIVYFDWKNKKSYNFINWQKQYNNVSLFLIGYWNPEVYNIPAQGDVQNLFAGRGLQFMFVWNH
ncbi:MAG: hypothetical protein H6540_01300 [Bacteroidales bacterium]|nr:hypothetical protein [Bacteroidales bacterium]